MIRHLLLLIPAALGRSLATRAGVATTGAMVALLFCAAAEADWFFQPSTYTHDPRTGERVEQFAAKPVGYPKELPNYVESGYRHRESRVRGADGSADRTHVVQTWGRGELIRPYGEWLRPFRAGATPYGPWGNPQGPWTLPFDSWINPYGQWNRGPWWQRGVGPIPHPGGPMGGPAYAPPGAAGEGMSELPTGPAYGGAYRSPGG